MKNFFGLMRNFKPPKKSEVDLALANFSRKEWLVFGVFALVFTVSALGILQIINKSFMISVPKKGGEISEGILGNPRLINPVLAFSDVDRDLVTLIYSGLLRKNTVGGFVPDLAESYEPSTDGLAHTFILRENLVFHDGSRLDADDVLFTVNMAKDPNIKSPRRISWEGINVEKIDDRTVKFTMRQPFASFLENATLGIMPEHLWKDSVIELSEANTSPIGSGPYKILKTKKHSSGLIESYTLEQFDKFSLGKPFIKKINLYFFSNENDLIAALQNKTIGQISSITPENAEVLEKRGYRVETSTLPRVFGLFFNQNQNQIFLNKNIITAINLAVDKKRIVERVLLGQGMVIDSPIPPGMLSGNNQINSIPRAERFERAKELLVKDGWLLGENGILEKTKTEKGKKTTTVLEFAISTGSSPELTKAAELIQEDLATLGMKVTVKTFEIGNLNQSVIRPRKYDALLFGQIINSHSDLYAFWHSSQRKDPGLNIAMYTNTRVDKLLEEAFVTINEEEREKKYAQFEEEVKKDIPAVFLYSPNFLYVIQANLNGLDFKNQIVSSSADRFRNVYLWYTETDNIWKIFSF